MKNKFLLGLFMIAILSLCFTYASSSNGWVEGHKVSESEWLKNTCPNLKNFSCDYTGDPVVLRVGYGVEFTDSIYAGGQDRWLKSQCSEIFEPDENGNYNKGDNPGFEFTENIRTAGGLVVKNNTPATLIIKSKADYQIRNHPVKRSSNNLMVKYAVEYVNDKKDNKQRYQHTECYPYIISRCGDGVVDKDWDGRCDKNGNNCKNPEQCDPASKDWIDRADGKTCSSTCTIVEPQDPVCSSSYNGKTEHTTSSEQWLKSTDKLCDEGSVDGFNFTPKTGGPRTYTWNCKNGSKITKSSCTAKQQWCGDGEKNGDEDCDDGDKNGTSASSCSKTCTTVGSATCGKKDGTTTYFTGGKQTEPWLTEKSDGLCPAGLTVGKPKMVGDYIEWTCSNKNGSERTCKAYQEWCGDGEKNGSEDCDGTDLCDFQCKKITPPKDCVNVFKGKLRLGQEHTFSDKFKAGGKDYYLYYGPDDVKFVENHGDYGTNPKFEWTSELTKKGNKVDANTEMVVMKSNPYKAVYKPTVRAWDNIYLEYTIWYSDVYKKTSPSKSNLYSNKECAYYEISWCGDGTLDTEYGEECDPGSAGTSTLSDGRTCNSDCKIESPKGEAVIEKTLKNKIEVSYTGQELTWEVKVTASGGNITNFEIWDKMPVELDYVNWELNKANTQNGIDVKYSNRKPNPKSSGEVNIHYWDVTGTLNKGKTITMFVKTKVNKMPGIGENILNIACVVKDGIEIDCGEDQPPKTEGYLVPDKTIIGTKEVKSTGDIIKWSLKVYAKGGNVKDPVIQDVLPSVLGYSGYKITHNPGLSIYTPTIGTVVEGGVDVETIEWKVIGTLEKNDYIEIELTTYAKKMPEKDYDNVLCARPKDKPADKKCDKEPIPAPKLWIKKYIMDGTNKIKEKTVKIGDEIVYRIEFGNKGTASATITSIKDFLPKNVGYRSSEVYVGGTKVNTEVVENTQKGELTLITNKYKVVDGVRIDIFGGLTLKPDTEGYIIIKGEILTGNQNNRTNFACIYLNDKKPDNDIVDGERCDSVVHNFGTGLLCSKPEITNKSFTSAGGSTEVVCKASGGQKADSIELDCGNGKIFTGSNIPSLTGTCVYPSNSTTSSISYPVVCKVNGKTDDICKDTVSIPGQSSPGCFPVGTKVTMADGTKKNIEEVKEGDMVLSYNTERNVNEGNVVKKLLVHEDNVHEMYELTINGEVLKVTDVHRFYVRESVSSEGYNWIEAKDLKVGNILLMTDGRLVEIEGIKHYPNKETVYNFEVENNHDYFVAEGYLVHNSKGGSPSCSSITTNPETLENGKDIEVTCKTSNGSAYILIDCDYKSTNKYDVTNKDKTYFESDGRKTEFKATCKNYKIDTKIQCLVKEYNSTKWESITAKDACGKSKTSSGGGGGSSGGGRTPTTPVVYPMAECFDINANQLSYEQGEILPFYWNLDNLSKDDIWYLSGSFSDKVKDGDKCEKDAEGLVALNSMECSYDIVDPDGTVKKTGNFPCLTEENFTVNHLYQSRLDIGKNKMCGTSNNKCYFDFTTKATKTRLWSKLNAIENFGAGWTRFGEYKIRMKKISYLRCNDGEWDSKEKSGESLCESTFMLTNPYTVQKTPSGNFRASTEALSNYRYCEKYKEVIDPNVKQECLRWNNADKLLNAIAVSEYQPNKAVDDAMQKFINKYSKLAVSAGDGLKKVPGKNIYFVNADIPCLGSQCPKSIDLSKPTTFVQTQGNTTIKGDLDSNLMLLTKGKIIFEDQESCNHRQVVKGIFYSALPVNGIQRTPVQKNTADRLKESNAKRCTEGGLTVKGVLIGNGLKQVMENSRSNLNKWHHSKTAQTVMNGASVLIEYSPSVFTKSTMPPGAEDFTTALSIYKD